MTPVVLDAGGCIGHSPPEIEMRLVGLVLNHLDHVIAGETELIERRICGQGSGTAEAGTDHFERHCRFSAAHVITGSHAPATAETERVLVLDLTYRNHFAFIRQ